MVIIFNPAAGRRRAQLLWRVLDVLVANGIRLQLSETRCAGHAARLARSAAANGAPMVVAAGGDGTIAEVASGLVGTRTRLGVIPLGTANVMAHELSLPFAPRAVAAALAFGRTREVWPGVVRGPDGERLFVQMLGVGFDAHVVHRLPNGLKRALGRGAYALQTLREAFGYQYRPIRLRIDDTETEAASVVVCKGRLYGGPFVLAPDAHTDAPGFEVVLFERGGARAVLCYGAALALNVLARAPGVRQVRARRVDFIGNERVAAQSDGDAAGWTPFSITDAPAPIPVVVG
jgi:diacylglycerol kinase (ATP)